MAKNIINSDDQPTIVNIQNETAPNRPYPRLQKAFEKPSLTRGSETANTDIKALVRRYGGINAVSNAALRPENFQDISNIPRDRIGAVLQINEANNLFKELPLKVRQAIDHDPRKLEAWIQANPQLSMEYGLLVETKPAPSPENPEPPTGGDVAAAGE